MVSVGESHSNSSRVHSIYSFHSPSSNSSTRIWREKGRSMRTVRSNLFSGEATAGQTDLASENLTDSFVDLRLGELASKTNHSLRPSFAEDDFLSLSHSCSDYSVCSSDISGELHRLATLSATEDENGEPKNAENSDAVASDQYEPCAGFLLRDSFSTEIIENISPEDLQPTVKICIDGLNSPSVAVKRSAAAKIRLLAKNRSDNRALIGESGAIPALIPLLRCSDPWTQEHAVTALLNLSLHPDNKMLIAGAGAVKSLIYVLKTGTEASKQNAAAALMNLAMVEDNKLSIGACGAIPPLVALLINGSSRSKKDALTTLYKLCSVNLNKERAVSAGVVKPLVELVAEQGAGMAEKAMVVLSSLSAIGEGKEAIVEEGGIAALVEAVEDSSDKGKEFAVLTLLQLCTDSVRNRGLLVREGGIPPLVSLSQSGTLRAKHKMHELSKLIRELKSILYGSSEAEPVPEACMQLTQEFFKENTFRLLVICLPKLNLETRKDATQIVANLQRQQVNSRLIASEYLEKNKDLMDILISSYETTDMALHYGSMLRECIRHQVVARYVLYSEHFRKFFHYIQLPNFDIAADAAATFKELLTRHKSTVAEFLSKNYDWFFTEYNEKLLESSNYITRRHAVKLLGDMLLDRSNSATMTKYVSSKDNLRILMNLLRETSKSIQMESFHVFKLFVANQNKPPDVANILYANKSKFLRLLAELKPDKEDEQFEQDKAQVMHEIAVLEPKELP